jgi:hypothetical protein
LHNKTLTITTILRHHAASKDLSRAHVLRFYWDGETTPSVEVPAPDFFAVGHEMFARVNSQVVIVNPANAMNCYWPMPMRTMNRPIIGVCIGGM